MHLPDKDLAEDAHLVLVGGSMLAHVLQAAGAEIIGAALEHGCTEVDAQRGAQVRQVLLDQLVLKVDGVRGDDHPGIILHREEGGGDQVGK